MKGLRTLGLLASVLAGTLPEAAAPQDAYAKQRAEMLAEIAATARATASETSRPRFADAVMAAMGRVPRHRLVPPEQVPYAYENRPLPIGHGQTISQPYIVALMTDLLDPKPSDVVLEIGTGSGYQAAVLAELVAKVYTIEIVAPVGKRAEAQLAALGYRNIAVRIGDGYLGWPEAAPFDAILVTAAPEQVPEPLIAQLAPGGRLVAPVGGEHAGQDLVLIEKAMDGTIRQRELLPVRFVPMRRAPDTTR
jgi:protein-L-isoaspartate(D-aspartate) O-methyltransferase